MFRSVGSTRTHACMWIYEGRMDGQGDGRTGRPAGGWAGLAASRVSSVHPKMRPPPARPPRFLCGACDAAIRCASEAVAQGGFFGRGASGWLRLRCPSRPPRPDRRTAWTGRSGRPTSEHGQATPRRSDQPARARRIGQRTGVGWGCPHMVSACARGASVLLARGTKPSRRQRDHVILRPCAGAQVRRS